MERKLIILLAIVLFSYSASAFSGAGSGTWADPYQITDCLELQEMDDELGANYTLMNNIDCSATSTWNGGEGFKPIGNDSDEGGAGPQFTGNFDGNFYTISSININRPSQDNVGLFGEVGDGVQIRNVHVTVANITGKDTSGILVGDAWNGYIYNSTTAGNINGTTLGLSIGGLAGYSEGIIDNCSSSADVWGNRVGGLIGINEGNVTNSFATGNITAPWDQSGGFIADNRGTLINNCYSTGNVNGQTTGDTLGGFIGINYANTLINNSYSTGSVMTGNSFLIGGFIGDNGNAANTITNSYSTGDVIISGYCDECGGFIGTSSGMDINNCSATGSVTTTGTSSSIGGFIGIASDPGTIENSYATGSINGDIIEYGGGFIGQATTYSATINITNCSASGSITSDRGRYAGGFIGHVDTINTTILNSSASGDVDCGVVLTSGYYCGGFIGYNLAKLINNSYSTGDVSGVSGIGGFFGYSGDTTNEGISVTQNSYSTGDISCTSTGGYLLCGGFAGGLEWVNILNSYATGSVIGEETYEMGGFSGVAYYFNINNSYSTGNVIGGYSGVGGFIGQAFVGNISNSFSTSNIIAGETLYGDGAMESSLVGYMGEVTLTNVYWYNTTNNPSYCYNTTAGTGNENCTAITDVTYFYDTTNPPMDVWDFTTIWDTIWNNIFFPPLRTQSENNYPINFTTPTPNNNTDSSGANWIYVNVTLSEVITGDTCLLDWNGTNITMTQASTQNYYINRTETVQGTYNYSVWCNVTQADVWLQSELRNHNITTVLPDTTPPTITAFYPANNTVYSSGLAETNITFTMYTDEEVDSVGWSESSIPLADMVNFTTVNGLAPAYRHTFSGTLPAQGGSKCFYVSGNDSSGNTMTTGEYCYTVQSPSSPGGGGGGGGEVIIGSPDNFVLYRTGGEIPCIGIPYCRNSMTYDASLGRYAPIKLRTCENTVKAPSDGEYTVCNLADHDTVLDLEIIGYTTQWGNTADFLELNQTELPLGNGTCDTFKVSISKNYPISANQVFSHSNSTHPFIINITGVEYDIAIEVERMDYECGSFSDFVSGDLIFGLPPWILFFILFIIILLILLGRSKRDDR